MGMTPSTGYHFKPSTKDDIVALADRHNMDNIFTFHPGRTQPFQAKDVFAVGVEKLGQTSLIKNFLARTSDTEANLDPGATEEEEEDISDTEMYELADLDFDEFEGPNDLLQ